uniref:Lebercilin n=1 Tax=Phallusia mammillata TaxID=59560 RepID=A0A6F9DJT0_9ASCI|nr:lebercilin [Phallusia mammillata]
MSRRRPKENTFTSDNDDEYSDYSEDFEHDSPSASPDHGLSNIRNKTRLIDKHDPNFSDDLTSSSYTTTTRSAKKSTQSEGRRRPAKQSSYKYGWRSNSFTKDTKKKFPTKDSVQSRMLSARRNRINILNNQLCETQVRLEEVMKENRLLKTLQHRQDRALRRFEGEENDLPRMISQHSEEQRILKARLRKSQDKERQLEKKLRETNEEMQKMENVLRRLKKMVYDKNLGERSELARQLSVAETRLEDFERKNKELNKKLELMTNSYTRQLNAERTRHRETKESLDILRDDHLSLQAKLKEKERALDVNNIYALRVKQSPEKSFVGGKVALMSPRQVEKQASPKPETPPRKPKPPLAIQESPEPQKPAPTVLKATTEVTDHRKTIKSPELEKTERENSALLDLSSATKEQQVTKGLNGLRLHEQKPKEDDHKRQSVFLTANFESPLTTPARSFIEDENKTKSSPAKQSILEDSLTASPPNVAKPLDFEDARRKAKEEELRRQQEEEERRRKADLLSKLRELEDDSSKISLEDNKPKINGVGHRKLGGNGFHGNKVLMKQDKVNPNDPRVENLHMGVPSSLDGKTSKKSVPDVSEPDISFGGYAPSLGVQPKRKTKARTQLPKKPPQSKSSESESDEPLLDLNSGKAKKSDLLSQLFGDQAGKQTPTGSSPNHAKPQSDFVPAREKSNASKTTPRAKPVHSGYPWEKNVLAAPGDKGNGDATNQHQHVFATPLVKAVTSSFNDDDIEEMTL